LLILIIAVDWALLKDYKVALIELVAIENIDKLIITEDVKL
jgi:hypothetical protein